MTTASRSSARHLLITGGSGMLGGPLSQRAAAAGWQVTATYRSNPARVRAGRAVHLDFQDDGALAQLVDEVRPTAIIHAAVTERSGPGFARAIRLAGQQVGHVSAAAGVRLIALSTDLVFDGSEDRYTEQTPARPHPNSEYGRAKLDAERATLAAYPAALVVRTSLIYDFDVDNPQAGWMVRRLEQGDTLSLFTDQIRCPIWVWNLADALLELVETDQSGVMHVVGPEARSRYDLGMMLLDALGIAAEGRVKQTGAPESAPKKLVLDTARAQSSLRHTPLLTLEAARVAWDAAQRPP